MNHWQAAALGLVQGLTEFLPVSSSAHLVLLPWLLRWSYQGLAYDVALHWGTGIALLLYFRRDWARLLLAALGRGEAAERRLLWMLAAATVPAAAAGLLLEDHVEKLFHRPDRIAWTLMAFGLLLWLSDRLGTRSQTMGTMRWRDVLAIGVAQALAIVPGVSRSGVTITAGLGLGLQREDAARFSFLLSGPIVLGAGVLKLKDLDAASINGPFAAGVLVAAASGLAAIHFLLRYVRTKNLSIFVLYRLGLGLVMLSVFQNR